MEDIYVKKHISKNTNGSIRLCVLAYPIAYLISAILDEILYIINFFVPIIPSIDRDVCIISLVLGINVISLLHFWSAKTNAEGETKY